MGDLHEILEGTLPCGPHNFYSLSDMPLTLDEIMLIYHNPMCACICCGHEEVPGYHFTMGTFMGMLMISRRMCDACGGTGLIPYQCAN